jgi:hypothetical protein
MYMEYIRTFSWTLDLIPYTYVHYMLIHSLDIQYSVYLYLTYTNTGVRSTLLKTHFLFNLPRQ